MTAVDLTDEMKLAISWTITMINAFVMFTSGLTIDIKEVWKFIKVHFRWAILIGLLCQYGMMPLLAFAFTNNLNDSQSLAVIIQATCPGSAILNLFSAWCAGNRLLAQTLASVGTISAIVLMPLCLLIYSKATLDSEECKWEYETADGLNDGVCPPIPYGPICRTLSILIASLTIGILVKYRFKRYKVIKKISKVGTILGLLVIMTFIVLAILIYEQAWLVQKEMWICATCIPLIAYIAGFMIAWAAKFLIGVLVSKYKVHFIEPEALIEFDWSECRTIGLACGLQNAQLGMSTVFGAYSMDDKVISDMHSYSPLYGVIELTYAFIISAGFLLIERYYYNIKRAPGPRIPNVNIEGQQHYLDDWTDDNAVFTPEAIRDLLKRLPRGLVKRMGVDDLNYEDMDEDQTYATMQTIASYVDVDTVHDETSPDEQRAMDDLIMWNTLQRQKEDEEASPDLVLRQRRPLQEPAQPQDITRFPSHIADFSADTPRDDRIPSHIADFSAKPPSQKPSRFSVTKSHVELEHEIETEIKMKTPKLSRFSIKTASHPDVEPEVEPEMAMPRVIRRGKFTISSHNTIPETPVLTPDGSTFDRAGIESTTSEFEPFHLNQPVQKSSTNRSSTNRYQTMSVQSEPTRDSNANEKPKLQSHLSLPDQLPVGKPDQKGRFAIRQSKQQRKESTDSFDDVFEDVPEFVRVNLSPDGAIEDNQPNQSEA